MNADFTNPLSSFILEWNHGSDGGEHGSDEPTLFVKTEPLNKERDWAYIGYPRRWSSEHIRFLEHSGI